MWSIVAKVQRCQCPQRASTYFFERKSRMHKVTKYGVNALNGLLLISSALKYALKEYCGCCVNALNGLLLISSALQLLVERKRISMCQCPQRASTYFFQELQISKGKVNKVSMPSTGFYLFLPGDYEVNDLASCVSMPSTGFYLFLPVPSQNP